MKKVADPKPSMMRVDALTPHPKNPRTHPSQQVERIGKAFEEFGVIQYPVVDENGMILAGEGRWLAAQQVGLKKLPVVVVTGWSEEKKIAFMVSDNRLAALGGYDDSKLRAVMQELQVAEFDLAPLGYDEKEFERLVAELEPPAEFQSFGADIPTEHKCPRCKYTWSGSSAPPAPPAPKKNGRAKAAKTKEA